MTARQPIPGNPAAACCDGKTRFASAELAHAVERRANKGSKPHREAYRCPYCGGWHLGEKRAKKPLRTGRPKFLETGA